jgi:VWFA-related protein
VVVELVTTDVTVHDANGNFVSNLTRDDFEVYEDGVKQQVQSLTLSHGGRITNVLAPPPPQPEGLILPVPHATNDVSGRIIVFFIDDLHLQFRNGPRVKTLLKRAGDLLLHEGDLFGVVSSGPSAISMQLTYDKKRFEDIIERVTGDELRPSDIINGMTGTYGPSEVQYRARVAMGTVEELLNNLEKIHNRRKALVYVSDGYDFIPFQDARLGLMKQGMPFLQNQKYLDQQDANPQTDTSGSTTTDPNPAGTLEKQKETFTENDLAYALADLTRTANRANTTIYALDPRGAVGTPDLDEPVEPRQWSEFVRKSQNTLRELADDTGGMAVVGTNDFDRALKRIDAEASDYYVLGYYSSNTDRTHRLREIDVRVLPPGLEVLARKEYIIGPTGTQSPPPNKR